MESIGLEIEGPHRDLLERKFEPERIRVELFLPATADRADIEFGGFPQTGPGSEQPGLLESLKGGKVLVGLTPEPTLLNAELTG